MPPSPSWVESANSAATDFPLDNLPCGVFSTGGGLRRCGVAIGDMILDAAGAEAAGLLRPGLRPNAAPLLGGGSWNALMAAGSEAWAGLRAGLTRLLSAAGGADREAVGRHLVPMAEAELHLPFEVAEFTDFYASEHHARNVGTMFRGPENALPPNWTHIPIGYNGRASSVVVSGAPVRRPWGQLKGPGDDGPRFAPSERFDFELEIGAVVGGSSRGIVSVADADAMIFGHVLLNDWSARDVQAWEYQPLGPFQAKATATTIGPWIVTRAALEPHRVRGPGGDARGRDLLPYLREPGPMLHDIALEVALAPEGAAPETIARTNFATMRYSSAQQLAHHTACGCPMRVGDLLGSGTVSGEGRDARGSLLELAWGGREPIEVGGRPRAFLEDGDTVILRGHAGTDGVRIGFGECRGTVLPAVSKPAWA